jgi:predicted TIM-barrel fold metal-dependent hydrolase
MNYGMIDCDLHVLPQHYDEIRKHLDPKWHYKLGEQHLMERDLYVHPIQGVRVDAKPPSGLLTGSDPDFLREQLIDAYGMEKVVITHRAFCNPHPNAAAKASAYNDWLAETWLGKYNHDGVFKGSIQIAHQDPAAAAREIERWAGHPHMVQVVADSGSRLPFGNRLHDPIFAACEKYDLPFATHVGTDGMGINVMASVGYPSYYMEWTTGKSIAYGAHLVSLLVEGVFERFPRLRVALIEGGVTGYVPLLWRFKHTL